MAMKTSYIKKILEQTHIPHEEIKNFVKEHVILPIFKTSAKKVLNADDGSVTMISEYICSRCNERFTIYGENNHYVVCPNCELEDIAYHTQVLPDIEADFKFCDEIDVEFSERNEEQNNRQNFATYEYSLVENTNPTSASKIFALAKYEIETKLYFALFPCQLYFNISSECGVKKIVVDMLNDAIIFTDDEIVNIKNGKRTTMGIRKVHALYYNDKSRCIIAKDEDAIEFRAMVDKLSRDFRVNDVLLRAKNPCCDALNFYAIDILYSSIKTLSSNSKSIGKKQMQTTEMIAKIDMPKEFTKKTDKIVYFVRETDELASTMLVELTCPNCGQTMAITRKKSYYFNADEDFVKCEHCQHLINGQLLQSVNQINAHKVLIPVIQDYEDGLIVRDYMFEQQYENGTIKYSPIEHKSKTIAFIPKSVNRDNLIKSITLLRYSGTNGTYYSSKTLKLRNDIDSNIIQNEATNCNIEWSAVEKINAHISYGVYASIDKIAAYLLLYMAYPVMEKLQKAEMSELVCHIIGAFNWESNRMPMQYNLHSDKLHDALRFNKACLNMLNGFPTEKTEHLTRLQTLYLADNNLSEDDYKYIVMHKMNATAVADVCRKFNFTVHQVCEYIERVRLTQCLAPQTAISEWADYLDASQLIGCDFSDRRVKYPAALRTEHDKVMYKKKIIENHDIDERFRKTTKEYGEKYSLMGNKYIITYPKCLSDLFEEGRNLNHCVGSYGDSILSGDRIILFVREKKKPDVPYFTLEVRPTYNAVGQFYGHSNTPPTVAKNSDLIAFIKDWAKKHDIVYA